MSDEENLDRLAIALAYESGARTAPTVIAKGRGYIAKDIIEIAHQNGISIEANPMLAEALSGVPLDQSIPHELYAAVAEVIGFVLRSRRKP